jgi:hypothetical protein
MHADETPLREGFRGEHEVEGEVDVLVELTVLSEAPSEGITPLPVTNKVVEVVVLCINITLWQKT